VSQPDPTGELPVTAAKPPARYGAIGGARPGGLALPSYTTTGDTTKGYSNDLRARAVALVEDGESRREAARVLGLGASTAIRWMERWASTGSVAALPGTGHSRSPLEAHRQWLLDLVAAEPDLTLEEIRARLKSEKRLKTGTTSVWRFYERHDITFKKNSARRRTGSS
jgi:transposase